MRGIERTDADPVAGGITQAEYWNGEVGARWARNQMVLDAVFAPLTEALFARAALAPGQSVLDVGCGCGATTLEAARRVGSSGRVTGADISAPMLAVARARAEGEGGAATFAQADVEGADLGLFDQAISRFGVMFFANSAAALANIRRMLRPGGRLTFLCWRPIAQNPWFSVAYEAVLPLLTEPPAPPEPDAPGPFRFADADALRALLAGAGFADVACEAIDRDLVLGRGEGDAAAVADAVGVVLGFGPTSRLLREAEPALQAAAAAAVTRALTPYASGSTLRLGAGCWLVRAG